MGKCQRRGGVAAFRCWQQVRGSTPSLHKHPATAALRSQGAPPRTAGDAATACPGKRGSSGGRGALARRDGVQALQAQLAPVLQLRPVLAGGAQPVAARAARHHAFVLGAVALRGVGRGVGRGVRGQGSAGGSWKDRVARHRACLCVCLTCFQKGTSFHTMRRPCRGSREGGPWSVQVGAGLQVKASLAGRQTGTGVAAGRASLPQGGGPHLLRYELVAHGAARDVPLPEALQVPGQALTLHKGHPRGRADGPPAATAGAGGRLVHHSSEPGREAECGEVEGHSCHAGLDRAAAERLLV